MEERWAPAGPTVRHVLRPHGRLRWVVATCVGLWGLLALGFALPLTVSLVRMYPDLLLPSSLVQVRDEVGWGVTLLMVLAPVLLAAFLVVAVRAWAEWIARLTFARDEVLLGPLELTVVRRRWTTATVSAPREPLQVVDDLHGLSIWTQRTGITTISSLGSPQDRQQLADDLRAWAPAYLPPPVSARTPPHLPSGWYVTDPASAGLREPGLLLREPRQRVRELIGFLVVAVPLFAGFAIAAIDRALHPRGPDDAPAWGYLLVAAASLTVLVLWGRPRRRSEAYLVAPGRLLVGMVRDRPGGGWSSPPRSATRLFTRVDPDPDSRANQLMAELDGGPVTLLSTPPRSRSACELGAWLSHATGLPFRDELRFEP